MHIYGNIEKSAELCRDANEGWNLFLASWKSETVPWVKSSPSFLLNKYRTDRVAKKLLSACNASGPSSRLVRTLTFADGPTDKGMQGLFYMVKTKKDLHLWPADALKRILRQIRVHNGTKRECHPKLCPETIGVTLIQGNAYPTRSPPFTFSNCVSDYSLIFN